MDKQDHIRALLERWMQDVITSQEREELISLLQEQTLLEDIAPSLEHIWNTQIGQPVFSEEETAAMIQRILIEHPVEQEDVFPPSIRRVRVLRKWGWAAASIILVLGMGAYFWATNRQSPAIIVTSADIAPGKNGAILTLANGSQVVLDSLENGVIALQNGTKVLLQDGTLAYDPSGSAAGGIVYNTMTTPKGRQFQVTLPDGTKAWLNAASSIRYPTVFAGKERKIDVTGEVYLEVAKNAALPFRINVNDRTEIEVLGTHFNVNAYEDEASIHTTLLEGSIRVLVGQKMLPGNNLSSKTVSSILKPGQQAVVVIAGKAGENAPQPSSSPAIKVINNADIGKVMAWKNGLFNFEGASLEQVMRQLERWYDIEVVFEKNASPDMEFEGEMSRGVSLNGLLKMLERLGVSCKLEGRKLTILSSPER